MKTSGERNLDVLLASMEPLLSERVFVLVATRGQETKLRRGDVKPIMRFQEQEGETWIVSADDAKRVGVVGSFPSRMITLNVHSAHEAIGFLARITTELARAEISVNAVSAFCHDHLFVPAERAEDAMTVLNNLSESKQR